MITFYIAYPVGCNY